jgi:hypothetical protein
MEPKYTPTQAGLNHFPRQHLRHFVPKLSPSLILIKLSWETGISPKEAKA